MSKTCCWNTTTTKMADVVLDYARAEQDQAKADGLCVEPTVFKSRTDGYALWQAHATSMGLGSEWKAWSEDEPCQQRSVAEDTAAAFKGTLFCSLPQPGGALVTVVHPQRVPAVGRSTSCTSSAPVYGQTGERGKWCSPLDGDRL